MPQPLKWNQPGLKWNQHGATWSGTTANPPHKMNKTKAIINFDGYAAADLAPVAQTIHDQMTANAATFATPPVTMAALQTLLATFTTKLAAKASRATADILAFNAARDELETALGDLGNYVNGLAKGDAIIVEKSGIPSYTARQSGPPGVPAAPSDLRLRHGDVPGAIVARYRPDRERSMNEVQKCTGDPAIEANWQPVGIFSGGKAIIDGTLPGQLLWLRVRTCGTGGQMGAWSDPAQIRVV